MKKLPVILFLAITSVTYGQSKRRSDLDTLLDQYAQSINKADSLLGKKIWSQDAEVSFINPMGNAFGWNGVRNIYAMFSTTFSKRSLQYKDERWTNYGEFAWVTFDWVFDATFFAGHKTLQTKGRETQVWKMINGRWKLVHVHYSTIP